VSERDVVVVGACVDGATVDLLLDDDTEVKVPVVMMQGLVGDEDIEEASAAGLQVHITSQGPDIVSLELIEEALMLGWKFSDMPEVQVFWKAIFLLFLSNYYWKYRHFILFWFFNILYFHPC
jgi:hypothetical protein